MSTINKDDFEQCCNHCGELAIDCSCDGGLGSPLYTDEELRKITQGRYNVFEDYQGPEKK